jgi:F0F1-type ATP synthase delta subunit
MRDVTSTNPLREVQRDAANEAVTARVNETIRPNTRIETRIVG